jgi:hypothetical protein
MFNPQNHKKQKTKKKKKKKKKQGKRKENVWTLFLVSGLDSI